MAENLKNKAISSTIWKFAERILAQVISLIVSIIIARILSPSDYSVVAVVTIFFTFANIIISGGLNTALIQKKDADYEDYSSVLHVSVLISIAAYVALFFLAPVIANLYQQEILVLVIRIMGLTLPITAVKSIWCAYISSNLQFRKFFFSTIVGTIVSGIVGIIMAVKGYGAWALVAQQMINTTVDTIILFFSTRIHIVFKISFKKLKVLFKYGWKIFASSVIGTIYSEISPLIIGVKFSTDDLSYYTKGKSFPYLLSSTSTNTLSAVLFPVLAKNQDDKEKLLYYTRLFMKLCSFVVFPIMMGFFAVANNFISVILTDKWLPATYYIRIFCVVAMFDIVAIGNCETIKAMGKSGVYLIMDIIKKSIYFLVIFLFTWFSSSPEILALSAIACAFVQITVNSIPNQKYIGYKIRHQIIDLLPSLICSVAMATGVYFLGYLNINKILLLAIQVVSGVILYIVLSLIINKKTFFYTINMAKGFFTRKKDNVKNGEKKMKKIGILTLPNSVSFGASLQTYALRKYLNNSGFDAEVINYLPNKIKTESNYSKSALKRLFLKIMRKKMLREFQRFEKQIIKYPSKSITKEGLAKLDDRYDVFICGSDQVWNPYITGSDSSYFFDFSKKTKISYAPSFGISEIPDDYKAMMKSYLPHFSAISVRENEGKSIVKDITGLDSTIVMDPTFLIDSKDWISLCKHDKRTKKKYVFLFMLQHSDKMVEFANKLAADKGLELYVFGGPFFKGKKLDKNSIHVIGPDKWLSFVKNAEYVVTNSFHGIAFSLIFGKQFFTEYSAITNSRIIDIVEKFGLSSQLIDNNYDEYHLIDYDVVSNNIKEKADASKFFLNKVLSKE